MVSLHPKREVSKYIVIIKILRPVMFVLILFLVLLFLYTSQYQL
jgi:hypothetical protein